MGLIDQENGMMYFLNAEHPSTVLLRDGQASFIEKDLLLRKIGTPGEEDHVQIQTFQLRSGDIVIAGSDGRDDLEIGRRDDKRIINEDEEAFLRRVEEGRGDLGLIVDRLQEHGQLTDDLSLLRIAYRNAMAPILPDEDAPYRQRFREATDLLRSGQMTAGLAVLEELQTAYPSQPETGRYLGRVLYKLKRYEEAIAQLEPYFALYPGDTDLAHIISLAHKKLGRYDRAIEFGEKVALREPRSVNYLVNLADCYRLQGNLDRAAELAWRARELEPQHARLLNLEQLLPVGPREFVS
jgi:tetratricopeptide (TPR) repeat protein